MGETLLLVTIITLVVLTIRRARPVVLESPVIIQRPGQYHITLAPQLNRAQTYIENIARHFRLSHSSHTDIPAQYFEVRDPKVFSRGNNSYLLAITLRDGTLYFQATSPDEGRDPLQTLQLFSEAVLAQHPGGSPASVEDAGEIGAAVDAAAQQLHIDAKKLLAGN